MAHDRIIFYLATLVLCICEPQLEQGNGSFCLLYTKYFLKIALVRASDLRLFVEHEVSIEHRPDSIKIRLPAGEITIIREKTTITKKCEHLKVSLLLCEMTLQPLLT